MKTLLVLVLFVAGCTQVRTDAQVRSLQQVVGEGCMRAGSDFAVQGLVSRASKDELVLWNGKDRGSTLTVTLPSRGMMKDARKWLARQALDEVGRLQSPVILVARCVHGGTAPEALRVSFLGADGSSQEVVF